MIGTKLALCIMLMVLPGCSSHNQGTKTTTVTRTWNNKRVIDNPLVEVIKSIKGTPTGNTGKGFQVKNRTSRTKNNMGMYNGLCE